MKIVGHTLAVNKINIMILELKDIEKEIERQNKYKFFFEDLKKRNPSCGLIVIDNFYSNAIDTRNYILTQ